MGHVCARCACTRWTRLVVVNDTVSVVPIIFVRSPPHEFSSCPQCTPDRKSCPRCACGCQCAGVPALPACLDCRVRVLTRSRVGTCGGKLAARREPATLVVFLRGFEPTLPGQSQARPSPEAQLGRRGVLPRPPSPRPRAPGNSLVSALSRLGLSSPDAPTGPEIAPALTILSAAPPCMSA